MRLVRLMLILGPVILAGLPAAAQAPAAAELFVIANAAAGIDAPHRSAWDEFTSDVPTSGYLGIGQAWGDYDNDGWVDLFLAGGQSPSTLYRNNGDGTFSIPEQAADVALANAWTGGAVWADYDNDGWRDLYVLAHGPNVLFRNQSGAGFRDVTTTAGVGDAGKGSTAAWGDYDGDGLLDLFVANWRCYPECPRDNAAALASDRLYRNRGDGTFEDVSTLLGDKLRGAAFSASFADFDDDGDPDIYVVNDMGRNPTLPTWMYNHQARSPQPAQGWHRDGCSRYGHALNHLQVFYYPQDTPLELGPTEVLPGSHFLFNLVKFMGHYRSISWAVHTAAPAGSIFLTVYSIWHRRPPSTAPGIRNMLKYLYWRMAPPEHDWIVEPDFNLDDLNDLENTHYRGQRPPVPEQFRDWHDVAEMFYWLRGKSHQFGEFLGTDGWPMGHPPRQRPREFHTYPENPALESTRP